jgi:hypothetical protein
LKWVAILFLGSFALVMAVYFLMPAIDERDRQQRAAGEKVAVPAPAKGDPAKPPPKPSTDTAENRQKLVDALASKFDPAPAGWAGFEVRKVELKNLGQVAVTLNYFKKPSGYAQVQDDTEQVVRACLAWIQQQGHDPAKDWIMVTAWAHMPEVGETGKSLVRVMGRSIYDFNSDQINFKKDTNLW